MESFDLNRFKSAQQSRWDGYDTALGEMQSGRKCSHWIWYIFPQLAGLGRSGPATYYGLQGLAEAEAYLQDEQLGERLVEISRVVLASAEPDVRVLMGSSIDATKLRSCMTLFAQLPDADPVFRQVLEKYFDGREDPLTLRLLEQDENWM